MKTLPQVSATSEQLKLMSHNRFGVEIICGAAGSGKTSTALLRLRSLSNLCSERKQRTGANEPVKILVLTFNRTLAGYLRSLAEHQVEENDNIELEINTFGKWAITHLGTPNVQERKAALILAQLTRSFSSLTPEYITKEIDYLLGRFEPHNLESYITCERTGRGALPRVDRNLRRRILDEIVYPYKKSIELESILDWNDIAISMGQDIKSLNYDIIIADECQDFSANQLRAIKHHLAPDHNVTFVIDTVQQIYARGFTWAEAGYEARSERVHVLEANHRNTVEIARFAASILLGVGIEGNGALPNLNAAKTNGPLPLLINGNYSQQTEYIIKHINKNIDLTKDSVAFLKPLGGKWFKTLEYSLTNYGMEFVDITRGAEWPEGSENIALSTFHSAKGLEFDHVFILGFNNENTPFADEEKDDQVLILRKLLAVAVARARHSVIIGYKHGEQSKLIEYFEPGTYNEITL